MKSDVIAKHLLAGNSCGNCNNYTTHKMISIVEDASGTDEVEWTQDGKAYKMYNIEKCTHDWSPEEGVCDKWEKSRMQEGLVWGNLIPNYTTKIFEEEE